MTYSECAERYLTPPIRERFMRNMRRESSHKEHDEIRAYELSELIITAFQYDLTPEGGPYWARVSCKHRESTDWSDRR